MDPAAATGTEPAGAAALPDAALLRLMWLASPALPVGGFSYSEGLEAAVEAGLVHDEASAAAWLLDQLLLQQARADLAALAEAAACWAQAACGDAAAAASAHARCAALDAWLAATREAAELAAQSRQMGRSLGDWLRHDQAAAEADADAPAAPDPRLDALAGLGPADDPGPQWASAFALAAARAGATPRQAALAFAWGWAENQAQAAIKAVPLGQAAAQRLLRRLAAALPGAVDEALQRADDETRQAYTPGLAILSARHETQYSRLFRS